jgi:hypothetical protein
MKRKTRLTLWILGTLLALAPVTAGAQELITTKAAAVKTLTVPTVSAAEQRLRLEESGIAAALEGGYVPRSEACVCTNLGGVSLICPECDAEKRIEYCHLHDKACQDAAQLGGVREHSTFFCTTLQE